MKKYKVICPLINFQIPWNVLIGPHKRTDEETKQLFKERREKAVEGVELIDGVKVRYISKEDLEDLKREPFFSSFFPHEMREFISSGKFVLERIITTEESHEFETGNVIRSIILALRLLKGGCVFGSYMFYIRLSEKRGLAGWSPVQNLNPQTPMGWNKYALDFEEIPDLKKLLKKIQRVDFSKRKGLRLACKRFQRTYEEGDVEDQLIDLMIAFEALFLKGEKAVSRRGETIAIACSILLGRNEEEREEIRNSLTKAYSMRNSIVHGAEYKKESDMHEFVAQIEEYLRESIKKLLD